MNCFNPRYFEVKYGWEQQLLPWRERTIWRLVAADGNEICRASVASDGLVYVPWEELLERVGDAVDAMSCMLPARVTESAVSVSRNDESEWMPISKKRRAKARKEIAKKDEARVYAAPFSVWDDEERCEADEDRWDVGNETDESGDIHGKILGKSPEKHGRHSDRDRTYLGEKALTYKSRKKTGRKRRNRKRRRATTSERVERTRTRFLRLDGVSAELAQTATRARRFEQLMGMRESKQVAATISANRRRGLKVHARGVDIAREVLGTSAIQLQSNLKKTGTRHATTRAVPEFGSAVYVDFMPTVPGVAIGPVLLVME
jgi:hypothetical protein